MWTYRCRENQHQIKINAPWLLTTNNILLCWLLVLLFPTVKNDNATFIPRRRDVEDVTNTSFQQWRIQCLLWHGHTYLMHKHTNTRCTQCPCNSFCDTNYLSLAKLLWLHSFIAPTQPATGKATGMTISSHALAIIKGSPSGRCSKIHVLMRPAVTPECARSNNLWYYHLFVHMEISE